MSQHPACSWLLFIAVVFAVALMYLLAGATDAAPVNELSLGAAAQIQDEVSIAPNAPQNLNFKTRDEILALRSQLVGTQPKFLTKPYAPCEDVFGMIVDGKPWWGLNGEALWGEGERSIEGDSEESRFLLNPWILVGANAYAFQIWDADKVTDEDLRRSDFPLTWLPSSITWWPAKATAEVSYAVSSYNKQLYVWRDKMKDQQIMPEFALVAYNARDMGYHWLWVAPEGSQNIECVRKPSEPIRIDQFIHCGGSCGYPGGCNNMSPSIPAMDEIKYTALPALANVLLWKEKPRSVHDTADMTFVIRLQ